MGTRHSDATPSAAVDATYRGPLPDRLAYMGARRRYSGELLAEGVTVLTQHCSEQSIRGSKWDYMGSETVRRYVQRRAKGENNGVA
jgi:hypothetical protein